MEEPARRSNAQTSDQEIDTNPNWTNRVRNNHDVLVIQIRKDQIYRVPPPENALIVERHRNPEKRRRDPPCFKSALGICVFVSLVLLFVIILVLCLVPSIPSLLLMPNDPVFTVERFSVKNSSSAKTSKTHFEYDVKLTVQNKNNAVGILYEDDADVALSTKNDNVADAKFPGLDLRRGDNKGSVKLVFKGLIGNLPKNVKNSIKSGKSKVPVSFTMDMDVNTRMKVGISKSRIIRFTVSCSFEVDSLATKGKVRVVSQKCDSKRKIS